MGRVTWQQLETEPGGLAAADILDGFLTFLVTTAATTIVTVPAGRTWVGTITINCSCAEVGAGTVQPQATGVVSTAGAGVTPAASNYLRCTAVGGANVAGGTVGSQGNNNLESPFVVSAPAANPVQIQAASSQAGTFTEVDVSAIGNLV